MCNCNGRCCKCNPSQISSDDVFYVGAYLTNLGIYPNTNLTTILSIIDTIFASTSNIIIIKMESEAGFTITNQEFIGKTVQLVVFESISKNSGFTKLVSSPTITFTDGTSFSNGQTITIFLTQ